MKYFSAALAFGFWLGSIVVLSVYGHSLLAALVALTPVLLLCAVGALM